MTQDVMAQIEMARAGLRPAEETVAKAVLADPQAAIVATTADLADRAGVSQASVVRFARAIGYSGLPELRLALAQDLSREAVALEQNDIASGHINASDALDDVVAKLAFHEARSIEQTARLIDLDALDRVAHAIAGGRRSSCYGVGASGLAASDLSQKLERIGLICQFSADTHVQLVHAALATRESVAFGFSFSGRTVEVHRALTIARDSGALTVAVTGVPDSPVGQIADLVLLTSAREAQLRAAALASRMAQLAIVDFLFVRVAQLRFDSVEAALAQTRAAVDGQRIGRPSGE